MQNPEKLPFTVDARIITQLGEQLVPSDLMALAELVKNSYDADASMVSIDYQEETGSQPARIVIEDDGNGMDLDQIREGWMHIGTALKERDPLSPRLGRPLAGIKGIGRFAAQRLGDRLCLRTSPRDAQTTFTVMFNWKEFSAGRPLNSILHDVERGSATEDEHGAKLTITQLRRRWTIEDLTEVIKDLARIHVPYNRSVHADKKSDPGFEVVAAFHGEEGIEVIDELDLLREERAMHLHGEVDTEGKGTYLLEFFKPESSSKVVDFRSRRLVTGPLTFDVDLTILGEQWIDELGVRRARAIARKHGGVRIWRDGFRVFPYGQPGDDWLSLEEHIAARRPPLNLWRNQNVLGGVRISREANPDLQDLLTRRGMIETQAYKDLKDFVFEGLSVSATEHAALTNRKSRSSPRKPKPSEALKSTLDAVGTIEPPETAEKLSGEHHRPSMDPDFANELVRIVQQAEQEIINENQMLKVLASLGTGLAVFAHEMKTVSLEVAVSAKRLEGLANELPEPAGAQVHAEVQRMRSGMDSLATYARYVEDFVSEDTRVRRRTIELSEFLDTFFQVFASLLERRGIVYELHVPRGLWPCPVFRAELNSVYFNLLTNAVKALLAPGVKTRKVAVFGTRDGEGIVATFADTGCGIPDDIRKELFNPFVTRAHVPEDGALGRGTGLGLYIVREMLDDYGGNISLVEPPEGYITAIEVRIPAHRRSK